MRGKFITIEGQDGAGKSTNLATIEQMLLSAGIDFVLTREPGGTPVGEQLREILLDSNDEKIGDMAELLIVFAGRAQHIEQVIEPALSAGKWVLCDRFTDASYAYQGGGRGMPSSLIETLENLVQGDMRPDLTFLLDVPVEVGESRAGQRSAPDRFEQQRNDFKRKVRACYLARAEEQPKRFRVVDAGASLDQVKSTIQSLFAAFIQENSPLRMSE